MGAMIAAAAIGAAGSIYAANKASKDAKAQNKIAQEAIDKADPYSPYRKDAAERLNALQADPSSIQGTPEYKARIQSVQRQLASQGYTGSGNALVEAAEAGATVYQQAFDNLAMLSGASSGIANQQNAYTNRLNTASQGTQQNLSATSGVVGGLQGLVGAFNKPTGSAPAASSGGGGQFGWIGKGY